MLLREAFTEWQIAVPNDCDDVGLAAIQRDWSDLGRKAQADIEKCVMKARKCKRETVVVVTRPLCGGGRKFVSAHVQDVNKLVRPQGNILILATITWPWLRCVFLVPRVGIFLQRRAICCTYVTSNKNVWVTLPSSLKVRIMESMPVMIYKVKCIQLFYLQRHRQSGSHVPSLDETSHLHTCVFLLQELMERGLH